VPTAARSHWSAQSGSAPRGITDEDGAFVARGLRPGVVHLRIGLPFELGSAGAGLELYALEARDIAIVDGAPIELAIDAPFELALQVVELESQRPVRRFEIEDAARGRSTSVAGAFWQGWLPASTRQLGIRVPELGATVVELPAAPARSVLRVEIASGRTCELQLVGLPPGAAPERVRLGFWKGADGRGGPATPTTSYRVVDGRVRFSVPAGAEVVVGVLDFELDGRTWTSAPAFQPCIVGGRLRVDVRE
jgi:hypothetical protein